MFRKIFTLQNARMISTVYTGVALYHSYCALFNDASKLWELNKPQFMRNQDQPSIPALEENEECKNDPFYHFRVMTPGKRF